LVQQRDNADLIKSLHDAGFFVGSSKKGPQT